MTRKRRNKSNVPRRKRLKRANRLAFAKNWVATYEGKNTVRGYSKYFGVSLLCAVSELESLGFKTDPEYVKQLRQSEENRRKEREKRRQARAQEEIRDSDHYFYFIAGYTSNGLPYGITWEEFETGLDIDADDDY